MPAGSGHALAWLVVATASAIIMIASAASVRDAVRSPAAAPAVSVRAPSAWLGADRLRGGGVGAGGGAHIDTLDPRAVGTRVDASTTEIPSVTGGSTFNVRDYGAKGDGTTDDSGALRGALAALAAAKSGVLYVPTGQYAIASTVVVPQAVQQGACEVRARKAVQARVQQQPCPGPCVRRVSWHLSSVPHATCLITLTISRRLTGPVRQHTRMQRYRAPRTHSLHQIIGDGPSSILLWQQDQDLLRFEGASAAQLLLIQDLLIASVGSPKSSTSAAIRFVAGVTKSLLSQLTFLGQGSIPGVTTVTATRLGACMDLGNVTDTVTVRDVLVWDHTGDALRIGRGSEVRVSGGRFIAFNKTDNSVGIHVTGNNGGVHVWSTDLIGGHIGLLLDSSNGAGSNREIFITQATMDSNWRGLAVMDNSYVSVAGCWTASSDQDNIWVAPGASPLLSIAGGTIFNAGAEGGDPSQGMCNGIVVNGGSFTLSGVEIRNNKGKGLWVPNGAVTDYVVTGSRVFSNGQGMDLGGSGYVITGNAFSGNAKPSVFGGETGGAVVQGNANPTA